MSEPFHYSVPRSPRRASAWSLIPAAILGLSSLDGPSRQGGSGPGRPEEGPEHPASFEELERDLRAPRPGTRRSAVIKLAAMGERKAWDLVLRALSDRDSMVADEAQVALGAVVDKKLVADLLGRPGLRAQDPWVRVRVAEAFGRMQVEIDGQALARAIAPGELREQGEIDVARTLLWSIERLAGTKRLGGDRAKTYRAVEELARSRADPELRGAALEALQALAPLDAHALVVELLADRDGGLRCAALLAFSTFPEQECLTLSQRALEDPEPRVRAQAIENLEKLSSRAAILALVHEMEIEKRERLRWGILAFLRGRSGLDLGFDGVAWRGWAEKIEGPLATGERKGVRLSPVGSTKVSLAGLSLISDRVCFLIDFSGSTWGTKVGERTRKEILDGKLRAALEALPEGTRFNVMPYTNEPIPWEKALVPSTKANVKRAIEWFERCHQSGRGNFYDAAMLALSDPEVDAIVALTDGVPTGGHRWHLELMVELLVEKDRFRKVAFDSVLVDAPMGKRKLWQELAERTGGRMVVASLE